MCVRLSDDLKRLQCGVRSVSYRVKVFGRKSCHWTELPQRWFVFSIWKIVFHNAFICERDKGPLTLFRRFRLFLLLPEKINNTLITIDNGTWMPPQVYAGHKIDFSPPSVALPFNLGATKYPGAQVHMLANKDFFPLV